MPADEVDVTRRAPITPPDPVPDLDWDPARARGFADRAVELWEEFLKRLPSLPVAGPWSAEEVAAGVRRRVPEDGLSDDELFEYLRSLAFEWSMYPGHPRFMAYITGAGTVPGAPADLLAAGLNMNLGGWRLSPSGTEVELALIRWLADQFGLPATAGGLLVSGGPLANFVALKAARDNQASWDIRNRGVAAGPPLVLYASEEVHVTTDRAADMLGLGNDAVRKVITGDFRIQTEALRDAIRADREAGNFPFAVVGTAGTVATGSIDPLEQIAGICKDQGLWFHVDAAYEGPAVLAEDLRPLFAGIERADSMTFDPHKWLYTPHSGGCVLVRDSANLSASFAAAGGLHPRRQGAVRTRSGPRDDGASVQPGVPGAEGVGVAAGARAPGVRTAHLARRRAGPVHGRQGGGAARARAGGTRRALHLLLQVRPARPPRGARAGGLPEPVERAADDRHQSRPQGLLLERRAERRVLRACIVNFRTEAQDVDALLDLAGELGARLDGELRPETLGAARN